MTPSMVPTGHSQKVAGKVGFTFWKQAVIDGFGEGLVAPALPGGHPGVVGDRQASRTCCTSEWTRCRAWVRDSPDISRSS